MISTTAKTEEREGERAVLLLQLADGAGKQASERASERASEHMNGLLQLERHKRVRESRVVDGGGRRDVGERPKAQIQTEQTESLSERAVSRSVFAESGAGSTFLSPLNRGLEISADRPTDHFFSPPLCFSSLLFSSPLSLSRPKCKFVKVESREFLQLVVHKSRHSRF